MATSHNLTIDWLPDQGRFDARLLVLGDGGKTDRKGSGPTLAAAVEAAYRDASAKPPAIDFGAVAALDEAAIRDGWFWDAGYFSGTWMVACNDALSGGWMGEFEGTTLEGALKETGAWVEANAGKFAKRRRGHVEPAWLMAARLLLAARDKA